MLLEPGTLMDPATGAVTGSNETELGRVSNELTFQRSSKD